MSYVPLHHKYRPQTFAQLVGQEAIATTLSSALNKAQIAPAYLFTGARGTGKTSSARIFAKSLNCIASDRPTPEPCGECETCRSITKGNALDVIEIDAASNTGVDNIRELIDRAQFAPVQCRYKVYVIDECHMLTGAAFNALLKTLEEPPNRVVFVLATTDPQRVLPTIISRCQRFDFRRIPLESMVGHLTMIAQQESINITQEAIQLVSQIAQGGLRDAESLLDQLGLMPGQVGSEQVWDLVGAVPERDLLSLVRSIAQDDPESAIDLTRRLMDRGREPLIVLQNLASFYRDLLIARTAPNRPDLVAITPSTWDQMCELVQSLPGKLLLNSQQHLRSAELQIKNTTQPRLWLEVTLLGLLPSAIAPETVASTQTIQQTIAKPTAAAVSAPVTTPVAAVVSAPIATPVAAPTPTPATPVEPEPVVPAFEPPIATPIEPAPAPPAETPSTAFIADGAELQGLWQQILGEIDLASTRGIVSASCYLLELNGNALKIAVRTKGMLPTVKTKAQSLGKAATKALKQSVKISLVVVEGGEPVRSATVPPTPSNPNP
ncbi:MAG: DNA polymerase III subunit gamma/tau [Alkalinema sp. RU_4_3]|nr:DNA polymerase III subunit gamma/tau [Alkalinema sp. RU_4_3]